MKRQLIAFICSLLVGCGITTPTIVDSEHFTWDTGSLPPAVTGAGDLDNLAALVEPVRYATDYNLSDYLSPAETLARGSGDCTAYARLYMAGFAAQGDTVRMLEIWGPNGWIHAACLFYDTRINPSVLGWRLTSDNLVYLQTFGTDEHTAAQSSATYLCPSWYFIKERDNSGTLLWYMQKPR